MPVFVKVLAMPNTALEDKFKKAPPEMVTANKFTVPSSEQLAPEIVAVPAVAVNEP